MKKKYVGIILITAITLSCLAGCTKKENRQNVEEVQMKNGTIEVALNEPEEIIFEETAYAEPKCSLHMDEETGHTHEVVFTQFNDKEHLISCSESECSYLKSGAHFDAGNGYCVCGYNISLGVPDGQIK